MLERDLLRISAQAAKQGIWQRFLIGGLRAHLDIARALGFKDLTPDEHRQATAKEGAKLWPQQTERLISLGYHDALGLSEDEYRSSIPAYQEQPVRFQGRFEVPILVDPRVDLRRQLGLNKIDSKISEADLTRFVLFEGQRSDIPNTPYQIWVGFQHESKSDHEFGWDEQGLTVMEGLAVAREVPDYSEKTGSFSLDVVNSSLTKEEEIIYLQLTKRPYTDRLALQRGYSGITFAWRGKSKP